MNPKTNFLPGVTDKTNASTNESDGASGQTSRQASDFENGHYYTMTNAYERVYDNGPLNDELAEAIRVANIQKAIEDLGHCWKAAKEKANQ